MKNFVNLMINSVLSVNLIKKIDFTVKPQLSVKNGMEFF